ATRWCRVLCPPRGSARTSTSPPRTRRALAPAVSATFTSLPQACYMIAPIWRSVRRTLLWLYLGPLASGVRSVGPTTFGSLANKEHELVSASSFRFLNL